MTKRDRETAVENVLKRWRKLQEEVKAVEDDAANMAFSQGSGEPVQSSSISDKTARGAFLLESIDEKQKWVQVIVEAMNWLEEERPDIKKLLYGHYGMKYKNGYKRKYARMFTDYYCMEHSISRVEYFNRRIEGLDEVAYYATENGLLRNCKQFNSESNGRKPC